MALSNLPAYTPQSQLLAALLAQENHPVYSAGQGAVDVAGQLAQAYFLKKSLAKDQSDQAKLLAAAVSSGGNYQPDSQMPASAQIQTGSDSQAAGLPSAAPGPAPQLPDGMAAGGVPGLPQQQDTQLQANAPPPVPAGPVGPQSVQQRIQMLAQMVSKNPEMGQFLPQAMDLAKSMQPAGVSYLKTGPGETNTPLDQYGRPIPGAPVISGGQAPAMLEPVNLFDAKNPTAPPQGMTKADAETKMKSEPGRYSIAGAYDPASRITFRPATAAENVQNGLPAGTKGSQVSSTGEFHPPTKQAGQIGPAFDAYDGHPLGVVDLTDPDVSKRIAAGEVTTQQPKVLQTADVDKLTKLGNTTQELQQQLSTYKPEYSRIIGSDSKLRGFIGGKAYNEASEWFNHTQGALLNTVKDTVGRSPQLLEEFNKNRPEATDAPDVVMSKMNNLINLYKQEAGNIGNTYLQGGYLGRQITQSLGFDPRTTAVGAQPAAPAPPAQQFTPQQIQAELARRQASPK